MYTSNPSVFNIYFDINCLTGFYSHVISFPAVRLSMTDIFKITLWPTIISEVNFELLLYVFIYLHTVHHTNPIRRYKMVLLEEIYEMVIHLKILISNYTDEKSLLR